MNFIIRLLLLLTFSLLYSDAFATGVATTHMDPAPTVVPQSLFGPISLSAGNAAVVPGQQFCINITAANFDSVVAMQFTMAWDTSVIQYTNFILVDLPDPSNFGVNALPQGVMAVSWNAGQDTVGGNLPFESLPDGTVLFALCYTTVGEVGECTEVAFQNAPLPIEVITENSNQMDVGINNTNGVICIIEPLSLSSSEIVGVNCATAGQGEINLEFTGGTTPYMYQWSGPGGFTAITEDLDNLEHGTYFLTLTDNSQVPIIFTTSFEVTGNFATSIADAGENTSLNCYNNGIVELNGSSNPSSSDIVTEWFTNDGNIIGSVFNASIEADAPGTYYFVATNLFSNCSDTAEVVVTNQTTPPVANAGFTVNLNCQQSLVNLNGTNSSQGSGIVYQWATFNGNILSGATTLTPLIDMAGNYLLTVTNELTGCTNSSSVTVTQDGDLPTAVAGEDTTLTCLVMSIVLDGTGSSVGNNFSYLWYTNNGGTIQNATTLNPTIGDSGTYFLVVTDNDNICSDTSMVFVDLMVTPPMADAGGQDTISCDIFAVVLDGSNSAQGANYTYMWTTLDGNIFEGETTLSPVVDACGTYSLEVTNTSDGCKNQAQVTIICDTIAPVLQFMEAPVITCANPEVTVDASSSSFGPEYVYFWNSPFGNITGGQGTPMITVDESGVYGLLIEDITNGCLSLKTLFVALDTVSPLANAGLDASIECNEPLTLNAEGSALGDTISYLWTSFNGNILEGETSLMPMVDAGGAYIILVTNALNGCVGMDTVLIDGGLPLESAEVQAEDRICVSELLVTGNLPQAASGLWTSNHSGDLFENDTMESTLVMDLTPGLHTFYWTLSTLDCPDYASDSIEVFVEATPLAVEDTLDLSGYLTSHAINVLGNDDATQVEDWTLQLPLIPSPLVVTDLGNGLLDCSYPAGYFGMTSFEYFLCNANCPDLCDTALVRLNISEPLDTISFIPNGITPNGDGMNDEFIIPEIKLNPELYPDNEFIVFNRWGDVVYQAKPYNNDWNGTTSNGGKELPQGTYYYVIRLDIGAGKVYQGDVTILR
jgi:large repetitive protein